MRADAAPVYATKQAIRLPRGVLSMGMTATRSNEVRTVIIQKPWPLRWLQVPLQPGEES